MTNLWSFSPAILGLLIVVQAGLNRRISVHWGLGAVTFLNAVVLLFGSALVLLLALRKPELLPEGFALPQAEKQFSLWYVFPGLIGLAVVVGGPWSVARFGAAQTFMLIVSAQLFASVAWDLKVEGLPVSKQKWLGIGLTWLGVAISNWA